MTKVAIDLQASWKVALALSISIETWMTLNSYYRFAYNQVSYLLSNCFQSQLSVLCTLSTVLCIFLQCPTMIFFAFLMFGRTWLQPFFKGFLRRSLVYPSLFDGLRFDLSLRISSFGDSFFFTSPSHFNRFSRTIRGTRLLRSVCCVFCLTSLFLQLICNFFQPPIS